MTFENFPGTAPAYGLRRARAPAPLYLPAVSNLFLQFAVIFIIKIKPKSDYPLKTLYPRAFQTGQNHLIYYDFTTVE